MGHNLRIVDVRVSSKQDEAIRKWVAESFDDSLKDLFYCHGHDGYKEPKEPGIYLLTAHVSLGDNEAEIVHPRWSQLEIT